VKTTIELSLVLRETSEYRPNPLSPSQVGELLFRRLKLVGHGQSTDERNRARIAARSATSEPAREVVHALDAYKDRHKFVSTYVQSKVDDDGRVRCEWKQSGTTKAPGRLSSAKTWWGTGMNMQNQPHEGYPMFVAEPGWCLFYFDLEQAEARVVAWLAGIGKWIEDFEKARIGGDSRLSQVTGSGHVEARVQLTCRPRTSLEVEGKHGLQPTLRYIAKRCRHGLNYRMAAPRLAETTGLSAAAASDAYHRYHRTNPELRRWWDAVEAEVRSTGVLYNLYGRRWVLTELVTDKTLESIVAFKPQSTIGDKVNRITYMAEDDDEWPTGQG
jgi:DNA polymerase I-like protein with 3'-5' exonuclease and polymerase domains